MSKNDAVCIIPDHLQIPVIASFCSPFSAQTLKLAFPEPVCAPCPAVFLLPMMYTVAMVIIITLRLELHTVVWRVPAGVRTSPAHTTSIITGMVPAGGTADVLCCRRGVPGDDYPGILTTGHVQPARDSSAFCELASQRAVAKKSQYIAGSSCVTNADTSVARRKGPGGKSPGKCGRAGSEPTDCAPGRGATMVFDVDFPVFIYTPASPRLR